MGTAIIGLGRPKYVIFKVSADTSGMEPAVTLQNFTLHIDLRGQHWAED